MAQAVISDRPARQIATSAILTQTGFGVLHTILSPCNGVASMSPAVGATMGRAGWELLPQEWDYLPAPRELGTINLDSRSDAVRLSGGAAIGAILPGFRA